MRYLPWLALSTLLIPHGRAPSADPPATGTVRVTVTGIRAEQSGLLIVALYDHRSAWLRLDSARAVQRVPVTADSLVTAFDTLPYDSSYAIAVIHDHNGNDKLDMRWFPFPKPKEGAGVSQNHLRMGKPDYGQARFVVAGEVVDLRVALRY